MRSAGDLVALTDHEVDLCFSPFNDLSAVALAVSGGADSLALLHLFAAWRERLSWSGRVLVFTVDHQLRPESAAEAEFVKGAASRLGVDHKTLVWEGVKPDSNLQAAARDARYRLIADAMAAADVQALAIAHHRDDQVETFLDRLTRGSGVYGLGAMASDSYSERYRLRLLRPLLGFSKKQLVEYLTSFGESWAEDPTNEKDSYKRVRLRKLAQALEAEGLDVDRLTETAFRLGRAAEAIDVWVERFIEAEVELHPAGPMRFGCSCFAGLPEEVRLRILAKLLARLGAQSYVPRLSKLEDIERRLSSQVAFKGTLAGCVVERRGEYVFLWKEVGRVVPASIPVVPGQRLDWEGRYEVQLADMSSLENNGLVVGALVNLPDKFSRDGISWPEGWPKAAFAASPALWNAQGLLAICGFSPVCDAAAPWSVIPLSGS